MKTRVYIIALLSVMTLSLFASQYGPVGMKESFQSQQLLQPIANYKGDVYYAFDSRTPSQYTEESITGYTSRPTTGPRRGFDTPDDLNQSEEYPLGDGLWPLLLMAVVFGGVIYFRRKRAAE